MTTKALIIGDNLRSQYHREKIAKILKDVVFFHTSSEVYLRNKDEIIYPDVDIILICTHWSKNATLTDEVIKRYKGKNRIRVLIEKPIFKPSLDDYDYLNLDCRVLYNRRYLETTSILANACWSAIDKNERIDFYVFVSDDWQEKSKKINLFQNKNFIYIYLVHLIDSICYFFRLDVLKAFEISSMVTANGLILSISNTLLTVRLELSYKSTKLTRMRLRTQAGVTYKLDGFEKMMIYREDGSHEKTVYSSLVDADEKMWAEILENSQTLLPTIEQDKTCRSLLASISYQMTENFLH